MMAAAALAQAFPPVASHWGNGNAARGLPGSLPCGQYRLSQPPAGTGQSAFHRTHSMGSTGAKQHVAAAVRAASEVGAGKDAARDQQPQLDRRQLLVGSSFITASTGIERVPGNFADDTALASELPDNASWPFWSSGVDLLAVAVFLGAAYVCLCLLIPTLSILKPHNNGRFKLTFFVQEDPSTSLRTVPPLEGYGGNFGAMFVIDQPMTLSPDRSSTRIGTVRGMAVFAKNAAVGGPEIVWTAVFNDSRPGGYGRSSLNIQGFNDLSQEEREISVVGGTGEFRLARGWGILSTCFRDPVTRFATTNLTLFVKTSSDDEVSPSSYKER